MKQNVIEKVDEMDKITNDDVMTALMRIKPEYRNELLYTYKLADIANVFQVQNGFDIAIKSFRERNMHIINQMLGMAQLRMELYKLKDEQHEESEQPA